MKIVDKGYEINKKINDGSISDNYIETFLDNAKEYKDKGVLTEILLENADEASKNAINSKSDSLLRGIPITVSDCFAIRGSKSTCGSKSLEDFISLDNSNIFNILQNRETVVIAKTNMNEFGISSILETCSLKNMNIDIFGKSIKDAEFADALSVKCGVAPINISIDFNGKNRITAGYLNLFSFKPTVNSIDRYGVPSTANSFDEIAITAESPVDIENIFDALSKFEKNDEEFNKNSKIGILTNLDKLNISDDIMKAYSSFVDILSAKDFEIVEIDVNNLNLSENLNVFDLLSNVEIASNMSRYNGLLFGYRTKNYTNYEDMFENSRTESFTLDLKYRILLGTYLVTDENRDKYYIPAFSKRNKFDKLVDGIFEDVDFLLLPTSPYTFDEYLEIDNYDDKLKSSIFSFIGNMTGNPVITIPTNIENFGLQLMSKKLYDNKLFELSKIIERYLNEN